MVGPIGISRCITILTISAINPPGFRPRTGTKPRTILTEAGPADYNLLKSERVNGSEPPRKNGAREWRNWQTRET